MNSKKPLLILTGPTAVGKTELSIKIAKEINAEIISADSMQVYRGMDIGSAKIKSEEMQGIPHHLIDCLDPSETFNVVRFKELAQKAMNDIYSRNHIPLVVGGTGFYIQALLYDIDFTDNGEDKTYRHELEAIAASPGGIDKLHQKLSEVDSASAQLIHANNVKRVIRALEYYAETGQQISKHNTEQRENESPYRFCYFCLNDDRSKIYQRIDLRVDQMIEDGLIEEVMMLSKQGCTKEMISMQGLGYKEILLYLDGEITLEEAVYRIKRDTRHFAKRQLTWFRREKEVIWMDKQLLGNDTDKLLSFVLQEITKKNII